MITAKMCLLAGLYEESHGIVANHMYDPARDATFGMASKESFWWDGGEPVWVTAEKHGKSSGEGKKISPFGGKGEMKTTPQRLTRYKFTLKHNNTEKTAEL